MSAPIRATVKTVKPILSRSEDEVRKRVIALYKSWYRELPLLIHEYKLPVTLDYAKRKLRKEFSRRRDIRDLRVMDMLIIKAQMDLREVSNHWRTYPSVMDFISERKEKPKDFLSKFLSGQD